MVTPRQGGGKPSAPRRPNTFERHDLAWSYGIVVVGFIIVVALSIGGAL